jgi:hypothetical protein
MPVFELGNTYDIVFHSGTWIKILSGPGCNVFGFRIGEVAVMFDYIIKDSNLVTCWLHLVMTLTLVTVIQGTGVGRLMYALLFAAVFFCSKCHNTIVERWTGLLGAPPPPPPPIYPSIVSSFDCFGSSRSHAITVTNTIAYRM